jgi:hypothetical protein
MVAIMSDSGSMPSCVNLSRGVSPVVFAHLDEISSLARASVDISLIQRCRS